MNRAGQAGLSICPPPNGADEPRLMSICADAANFAYSRRGPTITDCDFSYMGDDAVNLHGVTLPVLAVKDGGKMIITARPYGGERFDYVVEAGDTIRVLRASDYKVMGHAAISSWSSAPDDAELTQTAKKYWPYEDGSMHFYKVRLKTAAAIKGGDFFDIPAIAAPHFRIENNYFHDHRARGIRVTASDGVIRDNRLERIKQMAITVGPEYEEWREAGWVHNILIADNKIHNVCEGGRSFAPDQYALGAISVFYRPPAELREKPWPHENKDIQIRNNTIDGSSTAGIFIRAAHGVVIEGNQLGHTNYVDAPQAGSALGMSVEQSIDVDEADNVTISKNIVH